MFNPAVADYGDEISPSVFNLIFAGTAAYGMFVFGLFALFFANVVLGPLAYVVIFCGTLLGTWIAVSDALPVKVMGVSFCAGGLGTICASFIHQYKIGSVAEIAGMTVLFVLVLGAIGSLFPALMRNVGGLLFSSLLALILAQLFIPLVYASMGLPMTGALHALDWFGIVVFAGYTVYDFGEAQDNEKTVENAMNSGFSVFLDAANLFIRLLSLFGDHNDD